MRCPFSLYEKQTKKGLVWYARFWNEKARKYTLTRSTEIYVEGKKKRRSEAESPYLQKIYLLPKKVTD